MRSPQLKPLKSTFIDSTPDCPGIYIIWKVNAIGGLKALYVGMSRTSIRARLQKHSKGAHNDHLKDYVSAYRPDLLFCYSIKNKKRIKIKETKIIKLLKPLTNKSENY